MNSKRFHIVKIEAVVTAGGVGDFQKKLYHQNLYFETLAHQINIDFNSSVSSLNVPKKMPDLMSFFFL